MGNQGRAAEGIRLAREWVQAGLIGEVRTVHVWQNSSMRTYSQENGGDDPAGPVETPPPTLHYDLWLGVAPERPYRASRSHGVWRGCTDYGCGVLGDWACHQLDAAFYALDLGRPTSIEAATTEPRVDSFPRSTALSWRFPARAGQPPVEVRWFDGGLLPPQPVDGFKFDKIGGSLFHGDKGVMWVGSHSSTARLLPEVRMQAMRDALPPKTIPRVKGGPHVEWVDAIRQDRRCGSDFDYAAPLAETVLLGVAAVRARARLEWDAAAGRVTNHESANQFIGPGYAYRSGWGV
jgi:predicted dehydrogenase